MTDAFVGRFVLESKENYEDFMKGVGVPDLYIAMSRNVKVITDISKDGDAYVIQRIRPQKTTSNRIIMDQECEFNTVRGDKIKVLATMEGERICVKGDKYIFHMEMIGGKLKETITFRGHTMSRVSKKE